MEKTITKIYTDGACAGNQNDTNLGGWGAVLEYGAHSKEIWGGEANTTNNRMEMKALIGAFESLKRDGLKIEVYSDSSYLMNCFREKWYVRWQSNGWLNSKKEPVENKDLWEALLPWVARNDISFYRVKGHVTARDEKSLKPVFKRFLEWNGNTFSYEDFLHITEMNNLADALANKGIDSLRT